MKMFGFLKGKIDLHVENVNLTEGATARGMIQLKLKKPLEAKGVYVELLRVKKKSKDTDHDVMSKVNVAPAGTYANQSFNFEMKIPEKVVVKNPEGALGHVVRAAKILGVGRIRYKWYLVARLDVKGFDVTKKVKVYLN